MNSSGSTMVDHLCDLFVQQVVKNNQLTIESFLRGIEVDLDTQNRLIGELIVEEVEYLVSRNQHADRFEYYRRFPGQKSAIEFAFARNGQMDSITVSRPLDPDSELDAESEEKIPTTLGQYQGLKKIGSGSFGVVFSALDTETNTMVALKFPRRGIIQNAHDLSQLVAEAATAQKLNHKGIIRSYGIRQQDGFICIVQQHVSGPNMRTWLSQRQSTRKIASVIADVADAIAYSHQQGFVHRDLKPSNIIIDGSDNPLICDFGLAVHESVQRFQKGIRCGTAQYMSPELVEGWTHRLDGRSDIWSLGVILYEALTGRRPFRNDLTEELYEEIVGGVVRPLRAINHRIDGELQRICLKCLSKAIRDRYLTADELARDLRLWLGEKPSKDWTHNPKIVPRGLCAFEHADSEFFSRLLPGPRDRLGLPDSIQYWKKRIEGGSEHERFQVGVIFGPSGSGKSSFVKAGLIPQLSRNLVKCVYVEASAKDTESTLAASVARQHRTISSDMPLPSMFALLKSDAAMQFSKRTLIIVDQFEQWLHENVEHRKCQLPNALRHCDGDHLQCILLVRDDFWASISRFMEVLEIDLNDRLNTKRIDRFDTVHAKRVLAEFGRAFGKLPDDLDSLSEQQVQFLDRVVNGLAHDDQVIGVQLALFSELFKNREWTNKELRRVGGSSSIGETFLENAFEWENSHPELTEYRQAVEPVLEALLPPPGQAIRRYMVRSEKLLAESGLSEEGFKKLLQILHRRLHIISPADPGPSNMLVGNAPNDCSKYYQLTHDFLVASIRKWIKQKKQKTVSGRAQLRANEVDNLIRSGHAIRLGPLESLEISLFAPRQRLSNDVRKAIRSSFRVYGTLIASVVIGIVATAFVFFQASRNHLDRANDAMTSFLGSSPKHMGKSLEQLQPFKAAIENDISKLLNSDDASQRRKASYVVLKLFGPNSKAVNVLVSSITTVTRDEIPSIRDALKCQTQSSLVELRKRFDIENNRESQVKYALMSLALGDRSLAEIVLDNDRDPTDGTKLIHMVRDWHFDLNHLANQVRQSKSPGFQFGMIIAAGRCECPGIGDLCLENWRKLVEHQFKDNRSSAVHGACWWFAKRWDINTLPEIAPRDVPQTDFEWWKRSILGENLTFVRVKNPSLSHSMLDTATSGKRWVWVCDRELPYTLVRKWIEALPPRDARRLSVTSDPAWNSITCGFPFYTSHLQYGLSANDLFECVNWISDQDGGGEFYEKKRIRNESDCWSLISGCDIKGIRVTTPQEWISASRAGCDMGIDFYWGNNTLLDLLSEYANHSEQIVENGEVLPSGQFIPNRRGFFDMSGNMHEISGRAFDAQELTNGYPSNGGDFTAGIWKFANSGPESGTPFDLPFAFNGCRLVLIGD